MAYFEHINCDSCPKHIDLLASAIIIITIQSRRDRYDIIRAEMCKHGLCNVCIIYNAIQKTGPPGYGCWDSHREVACYCERELLVPSIVLEDDCEFISDNIIEALNYYIQKTITKHLDFILLGHLSVVLIPINSKTAVGISFCTHAYIMNIGLQKWLIETPVSLQNRHLDYYTSKHINKQVAYPMIAFQKNLGTNNSFTPFAEHYCMQMYKGQYFAVVTTITHVIILVITVLMIIFRKTRRYAYIPILIYIPIIALCYMFPIFVSFTEKRGSEDTRAYKGPQRTFGRVKV